MLIDLIKEHALQAAQSGDFAAVASTLNALRSEVIDQTQWSFGLMMTQGNLPEQLVTGIASAVDAASQVNPLMKSAFIAFSTTGMQLHTNERQAMIEAIGAGLPPEAIAAVKALGVRSVPIVTTTADECRQVYLTDRLSAQIMNTTALIRERLTIDLTDEQTEAAILQAWREAV